MQVSFAGNPRKRYDFFRRHEVHYLRFLTKEEFYSLINANAEYETLKALESALDVKRYELNIRNGHVIELSIGDRKLKELPKSIKQFRHLESLNIAGDALDEFPSWISDLKRLKLLKFNNNYSDKLPSFEI